MSCSALSWSYDSELRLRALALELQDLRIRIDDEPVGLERTGDEDIPRLATVESDRLALILSKPCPEQREARQAGRSIMS
jgi:hypothetical protein